MRRNSAVAWRTAGSSSTSKMVSDPRGTGSGLSIRVDCNAAGRYAGQVNFEYRARSGLTVNPNESTILFDDTVHRRKPETRTFSGGLGCVKRLEDVRQVFARDAASIIADGDQSIVPHRNHRRLAVNIIAIEKNVGSLDAQVTALAHGVAGVGRKIH